MSDNMPLCLPMFHLFFHLFVQTYSMRLNGRIQNTTRSHGTAETIRTSTLGRLEAAISTDGGSSCSNWHLAESLVSTISSSQEHAKHIQHVLT